MGGNVWQWCMDPWDDKSGDKVLRGASWSNGALKLSLLSSCRVHAAPDSMTDNYGFRIVEATEGARPSSRSSPEVDLTKLAKPAPPKIAAPAPDQFVP